MLYKVSSSKTTSSHEFQDHEKFGFNQKKKKKTSWKWQLDRHEFSKYVLYFLYFIYFVWTKK